MSGSLPILEFAQRSILQNFPGGLPGSELARWSAAPTSMSVRSLTTVVPEGSSMTSKPECCQSSVPPPRLLWWWRLVPVELLRAEGSEALVGRETVPLPPSEEELRRSAAASRAACTPRPRSRTCSQLGRRRSQCIKHATTCHVNPDYFSHYPCLTCNHMPFESKLLQPCNRVLDLFQPPTLQKRMFGPPFDFISVSSKG